MFLELKTLCVSMVMWFELGHTRDPRLCFLVSSLLIQLSRTSFPRELSCGAKVVVVVSFSVSGLMVIAHSHLAL